MKPALSAFFDLPGVFEIERRGGSIRLTQYDPIGRWVWFPVWWWEN